MLTELFKSIGICVRNSRDPYRFFVYGDRAMAEKKVIPPDEIPLTATEFPTPVFQAMKKRNVRALIPDPVIPEKMRNHNVTWADPDPFIQLEQKNPKKNIGAANPYVLAPLLLNTKINWNKVNVKDTLMAAFAPTGSTSFANIFNPKKSILFSQRRLSARLTAHLVPGPGGTVHGAETSAAAPTGKVAKTYDPISPLANCPPPGAPAGSKPPAPLPFKKSTFGNITDVVDDSVQGACLDCYFIAALYSRAWCSYPAFPATPASCPGGYNFTFYTVPTPVDPVSHSVTKCATPRFPVDDNKQPVFAQMTTEWELYPALYEKAYALFTGLKTPSALPNATGTDPEIIAFPQGDPLLSLFHITKLLWDFTGNNTLGQPSAFLTQELAQSGFTSGYKAMNINLSAVVGASRKTKNPTVAWTYETKPACSSTFFGTNSPYGNDLIVPSHSYSILGSVTLKDSTGITRDYMVLRNPWGANYVDPSGSIGPYLAAGQFTPVTGVTIDLSKRTDGIFGLRTDVFDCCFQGFGWVQFRCA